MDHAPFIWSAYGITALILLWAAVSPLIRQSRAMRDIRLLQQLKSRSAESHDPNT